MDNCQNCGAPLTGSAFCTSCGTPVAVAAADPDATVVAPVAQTPPTPPNQPAPAVPPAPPTQPLPTGAVPPSGAPGAPWGSPPPGAQPPGAQPPGGFPPAPGGYGPPSGGGGGGNKKALVIIAAIVAVLLLVGGGIAAALLLTGDDKDDDRDGGKKDEAVSVEELCTEFDATGSAEWDEVQETMADFEERGLPEELEDHQEGFETLLEIVADSDTEDEGNEAFEEAYAEDEEFQEFMNELFEQCEVFEDDDDSGEDSATSAPEPQASTVTPSAADTVAPTADPSQMLEDMPTCDDYADPECQAEWERYAEEYDLS